MATSQTEKHPREQPDEHSAVEEGDKDCRTAGWHEATICSISNMTPTVTGLELKINPPETSRNGTKEAAPFSFEPGQWVDFYIPSINQIGGYSMTSIPSQLPTLQLAVKASSHPPAHWVTQNAKVGDGIRVRVGGDFVYEQNKNSNHSERKILFIAGGVGINPIYCMMRQLYEDVEKKNIKSKASLLYSASTCEELLFESELKEMERRHPDHFRIQCTTTRHEESTTDEALCKPESFRKGRIDMDMLKEATSWLHQDNNKDEALSAVYICGPPGMAENMTDLCCNNFGISKTSIHFEKWW